METMKHFFLLNEFLVLLRIQTGLVIFNQCCFSQTQTNAVLPLLYVTSTLTAPILVDRITAPANQDLQVTEKIAKVGETTLANKLVYCCTIRDGSLLETCDII